MTPPLHMFALQVKGSIIIIDKLLSGCHKVFLIFPYIFLQFQMGHPLPIPSSQSADRNQPLLLSISNNPIFHSTI